ncbi:MAG: zinc ribbon domain-containing protein [Burkholderiales bacterium]|nr:zinc ribbon domain-containing protein [Burkholderiales bacterium]
MSTDIDEFSDWFCQDCGVVFDPFDRDPDHVTCPDCGSGSVASMDELDSDAAKHADYEEMWAVEDGDGDDDDGDDEESDEAD